MPELRLREVRLPELRLPEMTREDIVRTIGDARRDLDLSAIDLSRVDLSRVDVPRAIASATKAAGLVRATRRSRLPFVLGGLVALGVIGFAILRSPAVRPRVEEAGRRARQAIDERRAAMATAESDGAAVDPVAVPIEPDAYVGGESAPEASETVPA